MHNRWIMQPVARLGTVQAAAARLFAILLLLVSLAPYASHAEAEPQSVLSIFVAPAAGHSKPDALGLRVAARLRQSAVLRVTDSESAADAVLHIDTVLWPVGSVSLNPRSHGGSFTNYQGYASADLASPSHQILWSYLATPRPLRMTGIIDNLADEISTKLIATAKAGITIAAPAANAPPAGVKGSALHAAGATFPAPLYAKWFQSFALQPGGVSISYDAVGSVKGMGELADGRIDIAASDIPAPGPDASLLRLPSVVGGIVPIYNLTAAGVSANQTINLTGEVLAEIYSGKITHWNDPKLRALNKSVRLPDAPIAVIHRSDGSGTTFAFTSYLARSSSDWSGKASADTVWPVGTGMAGNGGVADAVAKTANSIGYVELTYAIQHQLTYAAVRNHSGRYIKANLDSIAAAANGVHGDMAAIDKPLLDSPEKDAYPIASFTWLIVPSTLIDSKQRTVIQSFLRWMLVDGQRQCSSLGYAPLPRDLAREELHKVDALR